MQLTQQNVQFGSDEDRSTEGGLEQCLDWDAADPQMDLTADTPVAVTWASTTQDDWLTPSELYIG